MHAGTRIAYTLRIRGLPARWLTEITVWDPPVRFVDEQRKGPYRHWTHEHTFEEKDGGTLMRDVVKYAVPGWVLERFIDRYLVAPDIEKIFAYRGLKIQEILNSAGA
jgi:ligand-binding SRPBCC domain-containing protein